MFCPHCHNKIPDGSNICPLCYANLAGVRPQQTQREDAPEAGDARGARGEAEERAMERRPRQKKQTYAKGGRGAKRKSDRTPLIVACGLIVILAVIIVMIVRSMFGAGGASPSLATPTPEPEVTPGGENFMVFGATTSTPVPAVEITPEPLAVTPTPSPTPQINYTTLRKGDQGRDVVTMQQALAELGFLNGATDGNFGTGTETAVKNFQTANGLEADGIAGRMTLESLYRQSTVTPMPETTAAPGDILDLPG